MSLPGKLNPAGSQWSGGWDWRGEVTRRRSTSLTQEHFPAQSCVWRQTAAVCYLLGDTVRLSYTVN